VAGGNYHPATAGSGGRLRTLSFVLVVPVRLVRRAPCLIVEQALPCRGQERERPVKQGDDPPQITILSD